MLRRTNKDGNADRYDDTSLDCTERTPSGVFIVRENRRLFTCTLATAPRLGLRATSVSPYMPLSAANIVGHSAATSRSGDRCCVEPLAGFGSSTIPRRPPSWV